MVLDTINEVLGVFKSHAHSNALGLHLDIARFEHFKHIASRVPGCKHYRTGIFVALFGIKTRYYIILYFQRSNPSFKVHFTATSQYCVANILNNHREAVGANMWMSIDKNIFGSTMLIENLQDSVNRATFFASRV